MSYMLTPFSTLRCFESSLSASPSPPLRYPMLVVTAMMGILLALLLPVFGKAKAKGAG